MAKDIKTFQVQMSMLRRQKANHKYDIFTLSTNDRLLRNLDAPLALLNGTLNE